MAGAIVSCGVCGAEVRHYPSRPKKFCSPACYHVAQRRGEVKVGREPFRLYPCHGCGKQVNRTPAKDRSGNACDKVYCSRACYDAERERRRPNCAHCGKRVPTAHAKYCSWQCRVDGRKPKPCKCKNCGVVFSALKPVDRGSYVALVAYNGAKTCSPECANAWNRNNPERKRKISEAFRRDRHPNWQGGSHRNRFRGHEWEALSESIRDRAGRCCERCGMSEADNGRRLDVNHKEPFHQYRNKSAANRPSNLEALCRRCHTVTDWEWRKANPVQTVLTFR